MKKICMMHDFYEKSSAYPIRAQSGYHGIITFFFFFNDRFKNASRENDESSRRSTILLSEPTIDVIARASRQKLSRRSDVTRSIHLGVVTQRTEKTQSNFSHSSLT